MVFNDQPSVTIIRSKRGYFTLFTNGLFQGNYDTYLEAAQEADRLFAEDAV